MTSSFNGNNGNNGNAANSGGGGNATAVSGGWYFADRVDLPFITVNDTWPPPPAPPPPLTPIASLRISITRFPDRNWSAEWYAWLALNDFVQAPGWNALDAAFVPPWAPPPSGDWSVANASPLVQQELTDLATAAQDERADALGEILSQSDEFISYFLNQMTARPAAYPQTTKVLSIASLVGTFVAMYYKAKYQRPRPSQLLPALLPPIEVPGHASFPSGHSTQAHLMALCMNDVFAALSAPQLNGKTRQQDLFEGLWTLADRIARNREIAGLHYASDTTAGIKLATAILPLLKAGPPGSTHYQKTVAAAAQEWTP